MAFFKGIDDDDDNDDEDDDNDLDKRTTKCPFFIILAGKLGPAVSLYRYSCCYQSICWSHPLMVVKQDKVNEQMNKLDRGIFSVSDMATCRKRKSKFSQQEMNL